MKERFKSGVLNWWTVVSFSWAFFDLSPLNDNAHYFWLNPE
jgi:hypothetical protein